MKKSLNVAAGNLNNNPPEANVKKLAKPVAEAAAPTTKGAVPTKAKAGIKSGKNTRSQLGSGDAKLVCRYCGSDDLAPSFLERKDARCRACFKQRYGSARIRKRASVA